ncbi:molybdopterin-dependent oxidoreductase [Streptantibioticus ferralitis]|uniref:Molybdopterin-dependent oxidoreductase n=1 Tax=Streptantibioticus ferralitis TaxID=236510 RepID=A0ABT5YYL2_9ACTN|nr:molybdopterin-dependent oxidoreductase [Streptantibioticus ferralitis]MDF2256688.1 molybdopterin-dependent oxidoreductase [Streptantibioticus ferralitis]
MSRITAPPLMPTVRIRTLRLYGDLERPVNLSVAQLRRWPTHQAEVVFDCAANGAQHHVFAGPLLRDVVAEAGPTFDVRRRKDRSHFLIAVFGGDGHRAVLSWPEIDAEFGDSPVLLATSLDGHPLDAEGSQLVVPGDACGARYVSAITSIWVGAYLPPGSGEHQV